MQIILSHFFLFHLKVLQLQPSSKSLTQTFFVFCSKTMNFAVRGHVCAEFLVTPYPDLGTSNVFIY